MKILADSCCDLPSELLKKTQAKSIPLTITIGEHHYVDDGTVDIPSYIADMKSYRQAPRSACPSPDAYAQAMSESGEDTFVVTLSSRLSGSYNAASVGRDLAIEGGCPHRIHVFDSESASAGETYLALMLRELIDTGRTFEEIIACVQKKIASMHTLFVLESLDNLVKNGRVSHAAAALAGILSIRLVMSDDGKGGICQLGKVRGMKNALAQMVDTVRKHTEGLAAGSQRLVLSYCNCLERAKEVEQLIRQKCPAIDEIILAPTSALSSMYAYDGGIVIAY